MKYTIRLISLAMASAALGACGGGGGSSTTTNVTVPNVTASTGIFVDSPVGGINYSTATQGGKTSTKGEFLYVPGEAITFSIGNISLPTVAANATVTPLDIAKTTNINHQVVSNILVLLLSLDEDGDPSNGISIPTAAASQATNAVNFDVSPAAFAANDAVIKLVSNSGSVRKVLVSEAIAKAHFQDTLNGNGTTSKINVAPVAYAGSIQSELTGTTVTLDGSASSDANNDALTYLWVLTTKPLGSQAALNDSTSVKPTFLADVAGTYVASLVVNDGTVSSTASTVTVIASAANAAPVANAGAAQSVLVGSKVTLSGGASSDANGDVLTYAWSLTSEPAGSSAVLANSTSVSPTFTPDVAGSYQLRLVVNDGKLSSEAASVSVTAAIANVAPVANAGMAQNVVTGSNITLDASASSDANGDALTYAWTLTSKPVGSNAALAAATTAKPTFRADVAGNFVATLIVNDGKVNSAPATVTVTAASAQSSAAFNMAQTISDGAQSTTMAFSGLALMTGNLDAQSFFPPGKVADYTGFQFLRDNDPDNMGHNTSFLTRVANNAIYILTDSQLAQLSALAATQQAQIDLYGYKRYPLMQAFRRIIDGNIPSGSSGLNLNAMKKASRELYLIDGQISFDRAVLYANIINSLSASQKAYFDAMKGKGWSSWPDITDAQISAKMSSLAQGSKVAVMTYASDIYSWYAGSLEADVYFCPERHGTYYGGFYIKDAPAVGHEGYSIDEQMTATAGAALIDTSKGYVNQSQATTMYSLVATQKDNLNSIVSTRTQIATLLRSLSTSLGSADAVKTQVLSLSGTYGDLDGADNYYYATTFAQVYKTLSTDQKTKLAALRKSMMSGKYADGTAFDYSVATTPFLYSAVLTDAQVAPYITDSVTNVLFFEP
jgi:hypothetical protein